MKISRLFHSVLCAGAIVALFCAPRVIRAQAVSGDLTGTVFDASGAVIRGADVFAVNTGTNLKVAATANGDGEYRLANLPAGIYNLDASAAGFTPASLHGIVVETNKIATVVFTLKPGASNATVDISDAPAIIDTTTAAIGSSFDARAARDLPLSSLGPGVINLSLLNAGVASNGGLNIGSGPAVGGQRPRNNNFTIEGVDNNSRANTGPVVTVPNDATSEFTAQQNEFSSEFGHSSGGQFNVVARNGINTIHGIVYEYFENRNLNALDQQFASSGTFVKPRFDQNRFGGAVGGAIIRNKLFYFGNYEYQPVGQATTPGQIFTPTQKGFTTLAGIPGLNATNLAVFKQYAPVAATPLPNAAAFPLVNGVPVEIGQSSIVAPNYRNTTAAVASLDYNMSQSDQLRARYVVNRVVALDNGANLPVFFQLQTNDYDLAGITEYHNFNPALTNELRLGFNHSLTVTPSGNYKFPGLDAFPNLTFADLNGLQLGPNGIAPQSVAQNTYQLVDNIAWNRGNHTLKFGFEGRRAIAPINFVQQQRGDYEYSTLDLYLRDITPDESASRTLGSPVYYGNNRAFYGFAQDTWRYKPNLTFSAGVRYEYTSVPFTNQLQTLNAISSVPGVLVFGAPKAQTKNYAPRVGLAWSPGNKATTSIRAGFGMAYDVLYDNLGTNALPPQFATNVDVTGSGASNFLAKGGILPATSGAPLTAAQARAATSSYIPDQKLPYSIQWNAGIQQVFARDYTLEVRYLGTRGVHLNVQTRPNVIAPVTAANSLPTYLQAPSQARLNALPLTLNRLTAQSDISPAFAAAGFTNSRLLEDAPIGNSSYHGLAAQLTHRWSRDLQFTGAYTWSHLIDDSTADFFTTLLSPRRPQDFQNLRNERSSSALDHRHRFTFAAVYDMPLFRRSNAMLRNIAGNWSVAPVFIYESPEYVTALSQTDSNLNGDVFADRAIINLAGTDGLGSGVTQLTNSSGQVVAYLAKNPNARYIQAGPGAFATSGRNTLAGRPIDNVDLNLMKSFPLRERTRLQFSAQFFNLLNHAQFVPGSLNRADNPAVPLVGGNVFNYLTPGSATFNNPEAVYSSNPRIIQLALKLSF